MDRVTLLAMKDALRVRLVTLDAISVNCQTCQSWQKARCQVADAVPPPDVQRSGCDEWSWDEIPF